MIRKSFTAQICKKFIEIQWYVHNINHCYYNSNQSIRFFSLFFGKIEKNIEHKNEIHTVNLNKANRKERLCQWHVIISAMLYCDGAMRVLCDCIRIDISPFVDTHTYTRTFHSISRPYERIHFYFCTIQISLCTFLKCSIEYWLTFKQYNHFALFLRSFNGKYWFNEFRNEHNYWIKSTIGTHSFFKSGTMETSQTFCFRRIEFCLPYHRRWQNKCESLIPLQTQQDLLYHLNLKLMFI